MDVVTLGGVVFNTPMIGAIVLIDKFVQYVYIFEFIGSREITIQFRFKG